ncbi:MAG: hypothetical protein ACE5EL_09030, partial [Anaerolineae bacterium]
MSSPSGQQWTILMLRRATGDAMSRHRQAGGHWHRRLVGGMCVIGLGLGAQGLGPAVVGPDSVPGADRGAWVSPEAYGSGGPQGAAFEALPNHPHAVSQPTGRGRRIGALNWWRGRLYSGYGDYGANTGPIFISPFDPTTGRYEDAWR